jgi:hypothetical protein
MTDEIEDDGCWYESEDSGCACNADDVELPTDSDWNWDKDAGCYVCSGCGDTQ